MKKWLRRAVFAVPVVCILLAAGGAPVHAGRSQGTAATFEPTTGDLQ
jgi:biotin transporter BioY